MGRRYFAPGKRPRRYVCLFLLLSFLIGVRGEERNFVIKGRVKNLDGAVVTLQRMNGWKTAAVGFAVDTVKNGKFLIKGNLPSEELTLCYLDVNAENTPPLFGPCRVAEKRHYCQSSRQGAVIPVLAGKQFFARTARRTTLSGYCKASLIKSISNR